MTNLRCSPNCAAKNIRIYKRDASKKVPMAEENIAPVRGKDSMPRKRKRLIIKLVSMKSEKLNILSVR